MTLDTLAGELDQLLRDKYELQIGDIVSVLKTMPANRPSTAKLPKHDTDLLDAAGFSEDLGGYAKATIDALAHMTRLITTAASVAEVAAALGVKDSRIRQLRLARKLWAVDDNGNWVYPILQFQSDPNDGPTRQIRGLDQVFATLPEGLHPVAVANFLRTPYPDLTVDGFAQTPLAWLRSGGDVEAVLRLIEVADWAGR